MCALWCDGRVSINFWPYSACWLNELAWNSVKAVGFQENQNHAVYDFHFHKLEIFLTWSISFIEIHVWTPYLLMCFESDLDDSKNSHIKRITENGFETEIKFSCEKIASRRSHMYEQCSVHRKRNTLHLLLYYIYVYFHWSAHLSLCVECVKGCSRKY